MGRHSRRGPAPKSASGGRAKSGEGRAEQAPPAQAPPPSGGTPWRGPAPGGPVPQGYGTPAHGAPGYGGGTPAHGVPRYADGTPAQGAPRFPDGTSGRGVPRFPDGTPAHGVPRVPGGGAVQGTPAHGTPRVRGGHPEQREAGGGWGELGEGAGGTRYRQPDGPGLPRQRQAPRSGPRQEYVDAFDAVADDVFTPPRRRAPVPPRGPDPYASVTDRDFGVPGAGLTGSAAGTGHDLADGAPPAGEPDRAKGTRGRTFTGVAAAAVTTVLAVVVAGQVTGTGEDGARTPSPTGQARDAHDSASRSDGRPSPSSPTRAVALTYEQKLDRKYAFDPDLKGPGRFDAVPGVDEAPGKGRKYTYRVDVEQGLGLDAELFAQAVQRTLNDDRSWAHRGERTFERVRSGQPDFVITLASPGTTDVWCAKSGLDTSEEHVSCDSAATERVMINAYRWAQGSSTFGDRIRAYRQMLINHEIGHRLGYGHRNCEKDGDLAPVMQQQTKFLDHDGIHCLPNAWPYP
ncbi:DUF3152 domain-containing protein [Streptomyces sp. MUM 136J]|uniref:DUF3152 domain-containing protein n=1 Tax=Streptomyces sp. MUM 136J TaxID=2791992 RepID=UPI001F045D06|nr:DUF3152 domain-containing protein [Streptomyces sp. MUM 136J]MCH0569594.1 DUF3152 domain-containing protein [Streptomyces sp. MUM 136J]